MIWRFILLTQPKTDYGTDSGLLCTTTTMQQCSQSDTRTQSTLRYESFEKIYSTLCLCLSSDTLARLALLDFWFLFCSSTRRSGTVPVVSLQISSPSLWLKHYISLVDYPLHIQYRPSGSWKQQIALIIRTPDLSLKSSSCRAV
jgi:hypothetical protein